MTGTLNTLMVTVPAAIVVAAVYEHVPGGAGPSLPQPMRRTRAMYRCCARTLPPGSLVFGLLAVTVADQTFWQKVWAIKGREVARSSSGRYCTAPTKEFRACGWLPFTNGLCDRADDRRSCD